jgi:transposase
MYTRKRKYSYQFRLRCVEAVLKGKRSCREVAREKGFEESNLRLWIGFYEAYGKSGLKRSGNQKYSLSFKLGVLSAIAKEHLSIRSAAVRFNIPSESVIVSWQKMFREKGEMGLIAKPKGRPIKMKEPIKRKRRKSSKPLTREEALLQENEYLRAENELLKKLQALAQMKKKQKP